MNSRITTFHEHPIPHDRGISQKGFTHCNWVASGIWTPNQLFIVALVSNPGSSQDENIRRYHQIHNSTHYAASQTVRVEHLLIITRLSRNFYDNRRHYVPWMMAIRIARGSHPISEWQYILGETVPSFVCWHRCRNGSNCTLWFLLGLLF